MRLIQAASAGVALLLLWAQARERGSWAAR